MTPVESGFFFGGGSGVQALERSGKPLWVGVCFQGTGNPISTSPNTSHCCYICFPFADTPTPQPPHPRAQTSRTAGCNQIRSVRKQCKHRLGDFRYPSPQDYSFEASWGLPLGLALSQQNGRWGLKAGVLSPPQMTGGGLGSRWQHRGLGAEDRLPETFPKRLPSSLAPSQAVEGGPGGPIGLAPLINVR